MKKEECVIFYDEESSRKINFYKNPFRKFGIKSSDCIRYYNEVFGRRNITNPYEIDLKIDSWIDFIKTYNFKICGKYNKNSYISSLLLYQNNLFEEYNKVRDIRKSKKLPADISEILYSNVAHLETTSRMINVFIEEAIKNNVFGEKSAYFDNDEIFRIIIYVHIYYVLNNYRSRKVLSKTVVKNVLKIYPNNYIFYTLECPYMTTIYNANGAFLQYDINEGDNKNIMDVITNKIYGLNYMDTIFGLYALSKLNEYGTSHLPVNTLSIDDIYSYLKFQFKEINFKQFFKTICIHNNSINVDMDKIYKRQHKSKLEISPLILLDNQNIILSNALLIRSIEYIYNIMKNGVKPFIDDEINELTDKIIINNSKKMVDDVIELVSTKYTDSIIKRSVKSTFIYNDNIDHGDYDILIYIPSKRKVYSIEVKYMSSSFESSGLENDIKKICKNNGYGDKYKDRNQFLNSNILYLKKIFNIPKEVIVCVEPIFLTSKPIQFPFLSYKYEGFLFNYDLLIDFIEENIEYKSDIQKFYGSYTKNNL